MTVSYTFNKKNNSLDLTLNQESAVKDYYTFQKYLEESLQAEELLTRPFLRRDQLHISNEKELLKGQLATIEKMNNFAVELRS